MMPRDSNAHGTIFGGVLLSYIDQAGAVGAREHAPHRYVTVAMDSVQFREPVYVGDVLSFFTAVKRVGRTSITMRVCVQAEAVHRPARSRLGHRGRDHVCRRSTRIANRSPTTWSRRRRRRTRGTYDI